MENVSVLIDGKRFEHWADLELTLSLDAFSTARFVAPFEAERFEFRETFRPFSFRRLEIAVGDTRLFTGTMIGVHPSVDADSRTVDVTAYALPAVLEDCNAPGSTVPHEFRKIGLKAIAEQLLRPFGLSVRVPDGEGAIFEKVKLEEESRLIEFLKTLAAQRNIVLSNTPEGDLLCWRSRFPGNPVARLRAGDLPVTKVTASFDPQSYYTEITCFASAKRGRRGSKHTVTNPFLRSVLRPSTFRADDTEKADAPAAARARLGRMFANVASYQLEDMPTWRDPIGRLWQPNTTIQLTAPDAMIYRESEFLIRNVIFKQDKDRETVTLGLVLPGAFAGEPPQRLPWEE